MSKALSSRILTLLLAGLLSLTLATGCSADQPPAEQAEAAAEAAADQVAEAAGEAVDQATEAADQAEEAMAEIVEPPAEVPASNEEMPEETGSGNEQAPATRVADAGDEAAQPEAPAKPSPYRVGDHYSVLSPAQPTNVEPGEIEITEVFMYGCIHCYNFEPFVEKWLPTKPSNVVFMRVPALFNSPARIHARAFYAAETLGVLEETHMPFFQELHVNRQRMTDEDELASFFARFGVEREAFRQAYNSFAVDTKLRRAEAMGRRYRVSSTPTVIVNGKYVIDGDKVTSYQQILEIATYLAEQEASRG